MVRNGNETIKAETRTGKQGNIYKITAWLLTGEKVKAKAKLELKIRDLKEVTRDFHKYASSKRTMSFSYSLIRSLLSGVSMNI